MLHGNSITFILKLTIVLVKITHCLAYWIKISPYLPLHYERLNVCSHVFPICTDNVIYCTYSIYCKLFLLCRF